MGKNKGQPGARYEAYKYTAVHISYLVCITYTCTKYILRSNTSTRPTRIFQEYFHQQQRRRIRSSMLMKMHSRRIETYYIDITRILQGWLSDRATLGLPLLILLI